MGANPLFDNLLAGNLLVKAEGCMAALTLPPKQESTESRLKVKINKKNILKT